MDRYKRQHLGVLCLGVGLLYPLLLWGNGGRITNPVKVGSFPELLHVILDEILIPIGTILVIMAFIYSGFLYVTAQGNQEKIKAAHQGFLWTAVGALVLLGSWAISQVICETVQEIVEYELEC